MDYKDLYAKVAEIVSHMDGWQIATIQPYSHTRRVEKDGRRFYVRESNCGRRLEVYPLWPASCESPVGLKLSISVSVTRSSSTIARDIERRFLPAVMAEWEKIDARIKVMDSHDTVMESVADRFVPLMTKAERFWFGSSIKLTTASGAVTVYDHDSVSISMNDLKPETALAVVRLLHKKGSI